jgi:hypothetical protein
MDFDSRETAPELETVDTFDERWDEFEVFSDELEGAWHDSDERRKKMAKMEKALDGQLPSPFDQAEFIKGLKLSLGFFSKRQMGELVRITEHLGEGEAQQRDQELLERRADTGDAISAQELYQALDAFDSLMVKYYELVARLTLSERAEEEIEALMKVAWTAIEACAHAIKEAVKKQKKLTEIKLVVFRFEQQLNALDPDHAFVPKDL